jgi:hypothetical protein
MLPRDSKDRSLAINEDVHANHHDELSLFGVGTQQDAQLKVLPVTVHQEVKSSSLEHLLYDSSSTIVVGQKGSSCNLYVMSHRIYIIPEFGSTGYCGLTLHAFAAARL